MNRQRGSALVVALFGPAVCSGCVSSLECALVEAHLQPGTPGSLEDWREDWWVVVVFDCSNNLDSFLMPQAIAGPGEELIGGVDKVSDTGAEPGVARYVARLHWSRGAPGSAEKLFAAAASATGLPVRVRGHSMFRSPVLSNVMFIPADRVAQFLEKLPTRPDGNHGPRGSAR